MSERTGRKTRGTPTTSATYVYCLVSGRRRPSLGKGPRGLAGASAPRIIDVDDALWLVGADAPLDRYGSAPIERGLRDLDWVSGCALAHEAVVEHFARVGTVVPMKLFTLFADEGRALAHIARIRRRLQRVIERIVGCNEWGVRISFDEARAARASRKRDRATAPIASGTGFLVAKKREQVATRELALHARDQANEIFGELASRASDSLRRPLPALGPAGPRLRVLLDAVFLVPTRGAARFRTVARSHAARLAADGFGITMTGPWPPYSFVAETR